MKMYASWIPPNDGRRGCWFNIYEHEQSVAMCVSSKKEIIEVEVTEDENGEYYGFKEGDKISMIYPSLIQLEMCFPYGLKAEENKGEGKRVRLKIEQRNKS